MRKYCLSAFLVAGAGVLAPHDAASAADPTATDLIRLAPAVSSADRQARRIKVASSVTSSEHWRLLFLARYDYPDHFFLCIADGRDGTPLAYFSENRLFMYNAVDSEVMYFQEAKFDYTLQGADGGLDNRCSVTGSAGGSNILVDLKSLYGQAAKHDDLVHSSTRTFRLTRTFGEGESLVALVDPSRRCPFAHLELCDTEKELPPFVLHELSIDGDVRDPRPVPPSERAFVGKLRITSFNEKTPDGLAVPGFMQRCLVARQAVYR
jgi:hypothetical protein